MAKSFCGYPIDDGDDFLLQDIPRKYVSLKISALFAIFFITKMFQFQCNKQDYEIDENIYINSNLSMKVDRSPLLVKCKVG